MKPPYIRLPKHLAPVAPRAGAWIETMVEWWGASRDAVAPRAGAWIETISIICSDRSCCVAPRAGAWIETCV